MYWVRNNWRLGGSAQPKTRVSRSDVIWLNHREAVELEIDRLFDVPKANPSMPGWLGKRMKAIANVIKNMTTEERTKLVGAVAKMAEEGLPAEEQNQYFFSFLALKYICSCLQTCCQILNQAV